MAEIFKSFIMLTNANVTGSYKYQDKFQILPAPSHFPRAPYAEADHPCLLELRYNFTPNPSRKMPDQTTVADWIQRKDHERKIIHEIMSLFSVFSFSKFVQTQDIHSWSIRVDDDIAVEPEWRQLSYFVRDHQHEITGFTNSQAPKIDEVNTSQFYNFGARYTGSDFSIPDLFSSVLDAYYSMGSDDRNALLKSLALFSNAIKIKSISPSISFACFVSSIESLVEHIHKEVKVEKCKECSAPRYFVTRKFSEFLSKYSSDSKELIKFYKQAYGRRSEILHAGALFLGEHIPAEWAESDWESYHMNSGIERVCRIAFTNWVLERHPLNQVLMGRRP
ncbi:hypothetical protein N5E96_12380 [Pseudomonas mosselii]|uniref:hypothetical protein n=1 Tax=Pseudomonas mosselii TaxID=78327 RepID=UPI0024485738|nr:hypothetical protein [Pseudomonas mosselii]MDH1656541.1 hypothetical protein [Pseudomonas mosselii]MDH1717965.1 hypothetical protein [Pseudomonas mosselii]MDH1722081.1 hypothetical protein [Pseudomonas mosselii]